MERILVACPTAQEKAYCLQAWVDAYKALTYPQRMALMVDNTAGTLDLTHAIRKLGIPAIHVEPVGHNLYFWMEQSWDVIIAYALEHGCPWVASLEADVICPPETLEVLRSHAEGCDVVGHGYPTRGAWGGHRILALGCTLISTEWLLKRQHLWWRGPEQDIWAGARRYEFDGVLDTQHLDPPKDSAGVS